MTAPACAMDDELVEDPVPAVISLDDERKIHDMNEPEQLKSALREAEANLQILRKGIRLVASQMMTKYQKNQANLKMTLHTRQLR